jgi:YebC/PmpR family DNA-binding regulatory protein
MAGHSHWANIAAKKGVIDKKRGKLYTKLIREITVSARLGGGDPADNPRLRAAWDNALGANMPKDTIERAVARGAGGDDGADVEELTYEGYAQGGVAVLVEAMTDNRNRTVAEVRHAFNKYGGNLGTDGSVAYLFVRQGIMTYAPGADEDEIMEAALEAGADDIDVDSDGAISVITPWEQFGAVLDALRAQSLPPDDAEVTMVPSTYNECDVELAEKVLELIDALEELDDVQNVFSNGDFPDSVLGS